MLLILNALQLLAFLLPYLVGEYLNENHDGADWHPHILDLTAPDGYCADIGADFEVDFTSTTNPADPNNVSPTDYVFSVGAKSFNIIGPMDFR